jgi:guanine nucleotide-binding protein subunit alpha
MKLIHDNGYSEKERESYKDIIYSNVIQSMKNIVSAMKVMNIAVANPANTVHFNVIDALPSLIEGDSVPKDIAEAIKNLWQDGGVKACFARSNEYQLNDSSA